MSSAKRHLYSACNNMHCEIDNLIIHACNVVEAAEATEFSSYIEKAQRMQCDLMKALDRMNWLMERCEYPR